MKKLKIYTKTGDKGKTSLVGGKRLPKDNQRLKAIGSLDEVNATIGLSRSFITDKSINRILTDIQNELFNIGSELANPRGLGSSPKRVFTLGKEKVKSLEQAIDRYDSKLAQLKNFILPGGSKAASYIHLSRTTARRAERETTALARKEAVNPNIIVYINRLSDLLFVLARYLNKRSKVKDLPWKKD